MDSYHEFPIFSDWDILGYAQIPAACPDGFSGDLCDVQCHCKNYNTCNKATGACVDYECADGWGGNGCRQALPAHYEFIPRIVRVSDASLTIQWNAWDASIDYGTGPAEKYQIYLAQQGQTLVPVAESTDTVEEITGLLHDTTYDFAVSVFRVINTRSYEGSRGPITSATTSCGVPSQAPTITQISQDIGPHAVQLEWTVPAGSDWIKCSSGISAFIVFYADGLEKRVEGSTTRKTVIDNLYTCEEYYFSMQVANKDNIGPRSNGKTIITAPEKVSALSITSTSSEILQVTWTEPSGCIFTEYVVSHRLTHRDQCHPEQGQPMDERTLETSVNIDGLDAYSTYEIAVYATSGGNSAEPEIDNGITADTAPKGPPSNILYDLSEEMTLTYTWEQPVCGSRGGVIIKYEYMFGLDIKGGEATFGSTEPDSMVASFANLDYYKEYQFQIRANTSVGAGPYSEVTIASTPESYPDAPPEKIKPGEGNSKGQLRFSWQPPPEDNRNGVIILYEYQFDIHSEAMLTEWAVNDTTDGTSAVFTNLPHDTQFQFRIRALTSVGHGPFSPFVIARTPSDDAMIIGFSVTIGILVIISIIFALLCWKRRNSSKTPKETDFVTAVNTSPVALTTDGFAKYNAPSPANTKN
ncbi:tyrosine-protein phosphatase Lar-like [Amphiura filiformis]|uniref:tyrosine-protein phosphatase Lar-like n=1 Tax=Amphiura filiformis TaxID=82378 RepID=UPI003B220015